MKILTLDVNRLVDMSDQIERISEKTGNNINPIAVYADTPRGWCVQVFDDCDGCKGTPWEGALRVGVNHTRARNMRQYFQRQYGVPITWDELQAIKEHLFPECIAIEIYPPASQLVDLANMRWLWVLPACAVLPFNLSGENMLYG